MGSGQNRTADKRSTNVFEMSPGEKIHFKAQLILQHKHNNQNLKDVVENGNQILQYCAK